MVGFEAKNTDTINELYICRVCSLILREPFQLECGHRQCQTCIEATEGPTIKCPECHKETSRNEAMLDRGCKNDMKSVEIRCSLCEWSDSFKNYEEHLNQIHSNNSSVHIEHQTSHTNNERLVEMDISMGETNLFIVPVPAHQNNDNRMQQISETINDLADANQTLTDDTQRIRVQNQLRDLIQSSITDSSAVESSYQDQNARINGIQQHLATIRQTVEEAQSTSHDGTLTWKIFNVKEKMANAQSERQTSIYSPPFYSSSTGYKMRARLYLNGDGNARRTHMSLFFVLMRGPSDAILKFPFNYKVTFCLYDQTPQLRHIIDSFRPDIKSNSFQRPRSEMNIASGIPKFVPLSTLQQEGNPYVRDDIMFIKVMVDFGDMPSTLLPYAVSLNPGFPMHIQQQMIEQEAERRAQQQQQLP